MKSPKSEPGTFWASWSKHQRTSSQVWKKGEGGQSKALDQLDRLPMLTPTLLSSSNSDSDFELLPQFNSKDRH